MKLKEYCKCGGQLTGSVTPDKSAMEILRIFRKIHSAEGHYKVEPSECYAERRKAENVGIAIDNYADMED